MLAGIWRTFWSYLLPSGGSAYQQFRAIGLDLVLLALSGYALVAALLKLLSVRYPEKPVFRRLYVRWRNWWSTPTMSSGDPP